MATEIPQEFEKYLKTCQPLDLLKDAQKTDNPLVFQNPLLPVSLDPGKPNIIVVFGGSGSGKDTVIKTAKEKGLVNWVITATSRLRRVKDDEPDDTYIWMRQIKEGETEEEYYKNLIREYGLIEHDFHNGKLYGLEESKLVEAIGKGIALLRMDHTGTRTIRKMMGEKANILSVFVVPDSLEQIWERTQGRGADEKRFQEAIDQILLAPTLANFYLHNPDGKAGQAQEAFEWLVKNI